MKGPPGRKTLIDPSVAHQIFGRAGRPQFDSEGYVYALAHEDDVKILRYKQKMDQIPEDTKDPLLIKKRKKMKKKMPSRRTTEQYWNESHFQKLIDAPPTNLCSQGAMPWRLLAYLLSISPDVARLGEAVRKRLMDDKQIKKAQGELGQMLITLEKAGYVRLDPPQPKKDDDAGQVVFESVVEEVSQLAAAGEFDVTEAWTGSDQIANTNNSNENGPSGADDDSFGSGVGNNDAPDSESSGENSDTELEASDDSASTKNDESETSDSDEQSTENLKTVTAQPKPAKKQEPQSAASSPLKLTSSMKLILEAQGISTDGKSNDPNQTKLVQPTVEEEVYEPERAYPSESLLDLLTFKSVNAIYGMFLVKVLPYCDGAERIQALESVLVFPGALSRNLRIPRPDMLPPSRFTTGYLNTQLLKRGIVSAAELGLVQPKEPEDRFDDDDEWVRPINFPEKLLRLFRSEYSGVSEVPITDVWAAGELLNFEGDFNKLVTSRKLAKQEGIVFRHILRFILLCEEFMPHLEVGSVWHDELLDISGKLTAACRVVDAHSTDMMIESARAADPLLAETS
jgi:hypothetical protein